MEQRENTKTQTLLSQQEVKYIQTGVNILERENFLRRELTQFKQAPFATNELREYYERNITLIERKMSEEIQEAIVSDQDRLDQIKGYLAQAHNVNNIGLSALFYAKAAELQESLGLDCTDTLESAQRSIEERDKFSFSHQMLSDLLPEAIIVGVEKKLFSVKKLALLEKLKKVFVPLLRANADSSLVNDCFCMLSQDELNELENTIPRAERSIFDTAYIRYKIKDMPDASLLNTYLSDPRNMHFLKKLVVEYPDEVNTALHIFSSNPNFSVADQGNQLLDNLKRTSFLLGTGDFADLCKKELLSSSIIYQSSTAKFVTGLGKIVKTRLQEAVRQDNTKGLIDILDASPSDFVLFQIGVKQMMTSVIGEMVNNKHENRNIGTFVDWINAMSQQKENELSRIIHGLGGKEGSEGNSKVQAFLFSLFILPAQEKLQTAQAVKFQRADLFHAGQTVIDTLSQKKTDIGVRFKKEKDHIEKTIDDECSIFNEMTGYSTEIEVFYLDEHERHGYGFEFITPIRKDVRKAFSIASAFVGLNEALKKAGLLWPVAGHSIHTHVSGFESSSDKIKQTQQLFRNLNIICFALINPVDREEYMLKNRNERLISIDPIPNNLYKIQNRQGMILDALSLDIVIDFARYAKKIFVDQHTDYNSMQQINRTIYSIVNDISAYIDDEIASDHTSVNKAINPLTTIKDMYGKLRLNMTNLDIYGLKLLLSHQVDKAETAETRIKEELHDMKKRKLEGDKNITFAMLKVKTREAREATEGKINTDYFFLLGKEKRDECALLIHSKLLEALRDPR